MKLWHVPAFVALVSVFCIAAEAAEVKTLMDATYATPGGVPVKLDAYLVESDKSTPVLIFIHGGGWRQGDKRGLPRFLKEPLFEAGISIVSINYRLTDVAPYPAQVDDCTRAVQFVRSKAKEWNINPGRIALMGASAGGHLSLWVGLHDDRKKPDSPDPVERQSSRVSCIVNYFGPTDFRLLRPLERRHPAYMALFGGKKGDAKENIPDAVIEAASPITYVSSDDPPVLTAHGTADLLVPVSHAHALIEKLKEKGVGTESFILDGGGHGLWNIKPDWPDFRGATVIFLKKHLLN